MSTPPTDGSAASAGSAGTAGTEGTGRWGDPATRVSFDEPVQDPPFDPYRFGAPDHPVPPEYAPPGYPAGYVPPPVMPGSGPAYGTQYGTQYGPQNGSQYGPAFGGQHYPPYGYGTPQYPAPPHSSPYPRPRTGNGKAIAALVLGILSILFSVFSLLDLFLIIPAIVLGSLGLTDSKRTGSGRGLAVAGFVCATVGAVLAAALTIWLYPQVQRCVNDYPSNSAEYNTCIRDIVS